MPSKNQTIVLFAVMVLVALAMFISGQLTGDKKAATDGGAEAATQSQDTPIISETTTRTATPTASIENQPAVDNAVTPGEGDAPDAVESKRRATPTSSEGLSPSEKDPEQ